MLFNHLGNSVAGLETASAPPRGFELSSLGLQGEVQVG